MRVPYQRLLKPILFRFDPERVHDGFVALGEGLGTFGWGRRLVALAFGYRAGDATVEVDGLRYRTPVALAAGFDYNGRLTRILPHVGFGGVEVGSVTARPSPGNPRPRLTRLVRSRSLVVYKGLRNDGVDAIAHRLRSRPRDPDFVVGISIARTNDEQAASLEDGIRDYVTSLRRLVAEGVGDYYTINISCPNIYGGESFAEPTRLRLLLEALGEIQHSRPVYVKMPIDLPWEEFRVLLEVIDELGLQGVVIGNLNKRYDELDHPDEAPTEFRGGLSGRPCFARSTELVRRTRDSYGQRFTIIACGGILSADDALEKFRAGADLVQLITGMIFEGPHLMREIAGRYAKERRRGVEGRPGERTRWRSGTAAGARARPARR